MSLTKGFKFPKCQTRPVRDQKDKQPIIKRNNWASLVAQMVKSLPATQETRVQSLGWEHPLRREWQHTPVFSGELHEQRSLVGHSPWGLIELNTMKWLTHVRKGLRIRAKWFKNVRGHCAWDLNTMSLGQQFILVTPELENISMGFHIRSTQRSVISIHMNIAASI